MTVTIAQEDWQKVLAEVIGTFFFFFIGIGSIAAAGTQNLGVLYVALAHGVGLAVAISALGHVSGAHFNPAVTIALAMVRKISPLLAVLYILGQLIGGIAACLALAAVLPEGIWRQFNLGTPTINTGILNVYQGMLLEAILTFFLVLAVFGTAIDARANRVAGFGIGLTVFVDILVGGPITGGVMNPARAFAPALVSGTWGSDHMVYWIGPIVGAIVAALLYTRVFLPTGDEPLISAPAITDRALEPPLSEPNLVDDRDIQRVADER